MPVFYVNDNQIENNTIKIAGPDVKHINTVLRFTVNDELKVINSGFLYTVRILESCKNEIKTEIIVKEPYKKTSPVKLILACAVAKQKAMELVLQSATQLGVYKIVPVLTCRTIPVFNAKEREEKQKKYERIVYEAAKQCRCRNIPELGKIISYKEALETDSETVSILAYELETKVRLKDILKEYDKNRVFKILIGPEGGFTEDEIEAAKKVGVRVVSLGPNILKVETAVVSIVSDVLYEFS